jgi:aryl-alcohol dehydrogenase
MQVNAAVVREKGGLFHIETLHIEEPRADEVLVRVVATGVCHTDMVMRDLALPIPQPVVLGHEGAGIVERVGAQVTSVRPGDHVVMTFDSCGTCPSCRAHDPAYCHQFFPLNFLGTRADGTSSLSKNGERIHAHIFGQSSFATYALCHARNAIKVPQDAPLAILGPLACGVQTGAGAVMKALRVPKKASLAIFGTGAVGLSAVMAARAVGAEPIIAVDIIDERLAMAKSLGATHTVNGRSQDVVEAIMANTGGIGADFTLDTTGKTEIIGKAVQCLAPRGTCGIVGAVSFGDLLPIDGGHLMSAGRSVRGIVEGGVEPDTFIPFLIDLHQRGEFPFDRLIKSYPFSAINEAVHDSEAGKTIKPVLQIAQA